MIQKKYQVFISSTYTDLIEERKKVQEILLMADCIPAGMEAFVAANDAQFEVIKKVIDLCDYYVLIIGKRYGSINETTGISYTEMEYNYAVSKGIPILVFALDDSVDVSEDKKESDSHIIEKLDQFKGKAMTNRLASIWKTQSDLAGEVAISIMKAKQDTVRPGWIRGDEFNPEEDLKKINYLQEENNRLENHNKELQKAIEELKFNDFELEFDDKKIKATYSNSYGYNSSKFLTIKEVFAYVSIFMVKVSIVESKLLNYIAESFGASSTIYMSDKTLCNKISNQFLALQLMQTKWVEGKGLFYGLTAKGEKLRDELNLIKKQSEE